VEAEHLTDQVFYLPDATNTGLVVDGDNAIIIDTGLDDTKGRRLLRLLEQQGLQLLAIVATHAHADHAGAIWWLVNRTGALVYASPLEATLLRFPLLLPTSLYGGAAPPRNLRNKFLMPHQVPAVELPPAGRVTVGRVPLSVVPLPGHTLGHVGIEVDGVLFCGDSLFGRPVLEKHGVPFHVDVGAALATLDDLNDSPITWLVPGHGSATHEPSEEIEANRRRLLEIQRFIRAALAVEPLSTVDLTARCCQHFGAGLDAPSQCCLMTAAIGAHLSHLFDSGEIGATVRGGQLLWQERPSSSTVGTAD